MTPNAKHKYIFFSTNLLPLFLFVSYISKINAQVYSQSFSGTIAASGWTVTNLAAPWGNGSFFGISNVWQVSDSESGRPANTCGAGGMGNQSLYMGATALASGAAYISNANTNRRIASPNINTSGLNTLVLSFNFIGNGYLTTDKAYLQYSTDGGTTWNSPSGAPTSSNPALPVGSNLNNLKSTLCAPQGRWTNVTWNLPLACENIPNLRIAFVWQNNSATGGLAQDPSFAVDDVTITSGSLPIELLSFTGKNNGNENILKWETASETNNNFFTIERSVDGIYFNEIGKINGAGNSTSVLNYSLVDNNPTNGINYYRLKQTDFDGKYKYSSPISVSAENDNTLELIYFYNNHETELLSLTFNCTDDCYLTIELYDLLGKKIFFNSSEMLNNSSVFKIPTSNLSQSVYILKAYNKKQSISKKIIL